MTPIILALLLSCLTLLCLGAGGRADSVEPQKPAQASHGGWATVAAVPSADQPSEVAYKERRVTWSEALRGTVPAPQTTEGNRLSSAGDQAGTSAAGQRAKSTNDPVAYWAHLARKRLRLLGARERRIVHLLRRLRIGAGSHRHGDSASKSGSTPVRRAICSTFGSHCSEALHVAECESHFNVYARNGQYLGLFQMGSFARAKYGHSWNAWGQSRSAYRYFLDAGWSPWQCRP